MEGVQSMKCHGFLFWYFVGCKVSIYQTKINYPPNYLFFREGDWGPGDEQRLRELISRLKMDRSRVCDTIVELESVHAEAISTRVPVSLAEARKLDLETAVLMQVKITHC